MLYRYIYEVSVIVFDIGGSALEMLPAPRLGFPSHSYRNIPCIPLYASITETDQPHQFPQIRTESHTSLRMTYHSLQGCVR